MNINEIIRLCLLNDRNGQKELVQTFAPVLLTVARRYKSKMIEPEDILQESFIKIFSRLNNYDSNKGQFVHWLTKIVINTALDQLRTEKLKYNDWTNIENESSEEWQIDSDILININAEHLIKLIQELKPPYNQVFNLSVIDGYDHKEIAQMLNIEESSSRSYLHRARKILITKLEAEKFIIHENK